MPKALIVCAVMLAALPSAAMAWPSPGTISVELRGLHVEGKPITWSQRQVLMLGRDGQLWDFAPSEARNAKEVSRGFASYTANELRGRLHEELGRSFEVAHTGHYVVAFPRGQRDRWSQQFEEVYRSFVHYFSVRGLNPREPDFPMIAVVWPNQQEFLKHARQDGSGVDASVLGYYSPTSNRIQIYDLSGGNGSVNQQQNVDVLTHELTHQTAFNTGVHKRFAANPRWVVEGLGTMFEAKGVWDSRRFTKQSDRINQGRLQEYREFFGKGMKPGTLADLVSSDRMFETDPSQAYALSWSFTFYLVETQPRKYCEYLALTAKKGEFEDYPSAARLEDFISVFGQNIKLLESKYARYFQEEIR